MEESRLAQLERELQRLNFDINERTGYKCRTDMTKSVEYLQKLETKRAPLKVSRCKIAEKLFVEVRQRYYEMGDGIDFSLVQAPLMGMIYTLIGCDRLIDASYGTFSTILMESLGNVSKSDTASLKKGFILVGPVGTGKTLLINTLRKEVNRLQKQLPAIGMGPLYHAGTMCGDYEKNGASVVDQWTLHPVTIDEIGKDRLTAKYGNKTNPFENWLSVDRYNLFVESGVKMYGTSNFETAEEFTEQYPDERTRSRMLQMFNIIEIGHNYNLRR